MDLKKTIVWDNDDTINNFRFNWLAWFKIYNQIQFSYNEVFKENKPYNQLNLTKEELTNSMIKFKKEKYQYITIHPQIVYWFYTHGNNYNHIILTNLSREVFHNSIWATDKYLGRWIHSYNFVTSNKNSDMNEFISKAEFIDRNFKNIDIFIDDGEKNCEEVERLGIKTFCPKQPWNNGEEIECILKKIV